jgi:hypothetical protein
MGRVSSRHRRFRTKDEIVRDVTHVLRLPLKDGTKWAVLRDAAWVWTEFDGKYDGPFRTRKAWEHLQSGEKRLLRHEHVVPKIIVIQRLLDLQEPTEDQVRNICEKFLIGVVVTRDEDAILNARFRSRMPTEFMDSASCHFDDPWLRYWKCDIDLFFKDIATVERALKPLQLVDVESNECDGGRLPDPCDTLRKYECEDRTTWWWLPPTKTLFMRTVQIK